MTFPALVPRDAEAEVVAYLEAKTGLPTAAWVVADENGNIIVPSVRVDLTAAYRRNMITDQYQVSAQGYADNPEAAQQITAAAFAWLMGADEDPDSGVRVTESVGAPVPFNDPDFPQVYRYQATVLWTLRPQPLGA